MEVKSNCKNGTKYAEANPGDILSDFPDEMLSHILSFLPTEDAVRTSILSRRWKDVYKGVPNIKFSIDAYFLWMTAFEKMSELQATLGIMLSELQVKMREMEEDMDAFMKLHETMTASSEQRSDTHDDDDDDDDDDALESK